MKREREKTAAEPASAAHDAGAQDTGGPVTPGGYSVSLPEFDGPLDLLLCLIQEHELDILDIPIGFIAAKYVEYITLMQQLNIDLASEYLVMAATLAHIKSKMLLPAPPEDQEEGEEIELDPRAELVRRLLEYQKYKHVAEQLAARDLLGRDVFVRAGGNPIPEGQPPLAPVTLFKLLEAFKRILDRAHQTIDHQVQFERLSLTDRINELVDLLGERQSFVVSSLFEAQRSRAELVVTLLALLEMTRLRMIRLTQTGPLEEITVELAVSEEQAALAVAAAAAAAGAGPFDAPDAAGSGPSEPRFESDEAPEPAGAESVLDGSNTDEQASPRAEGELSRTEAEGQLAETQSEAMGEPEAIGSIELTHPQGADAATAVVPDETTPSGEQASFEAEPPGESGVGEAGVPEAPAGAAVVEPSEPEEAVRVAEPVALAEDTEAGVRALETDTSGTFEGPAEQRAADEAVQQDPAAGETGQASASSPVEAEEPARECGGTEAAEASIDSNSEQQR